MVWNLQEIKLLQGKFEDIKGVLEGQAMQWLNQRKGQNKKDKHCSTNTLHRKVNIEQHDLTKTQW